VPGEGDPPGDVVVDDGGNSPAIAVKLTVPRTCKLSCEVE
jgi:hypothetical protein